VGSTSSTRTPWTLSRPCERWGSSDGEVDTKFNDGDIVRCTSKLGGGYLFGETYTVTDTYMDSDGERIHTIDSNGKDNGWHVRHFELVTPKVKPRGSDFFPQTKDSVRTFGTGATRDLDANKLDFEGFLSPLVLERYAQHMHAARKMPDGTMRASDNWQLGIPKDAYIKSAWRHFFDVWKTHRGIETSSDIETELCALLFNVSGYLHETLKAKRALPKVD
jgi:hypothetical protein